MDRKYDFKINARLFPMKAHYFLYNGALSGVLPFLPVIAKQLGISAIAFGIIYTTLQFISMIAKPLFGGIADRFHKLKIMLIVFIVIIILATLGINFIPSINKNEKHLNSTVLCTTSGTTIWFSNHSYQKCIQYMPKEEVFHCELQCFKCESNEENLEFIGQNETSSHCEKNQTHNIQLEMYLKPKNYSETYSVFDVKNMSVDLQNSTDVCSTHSNFICNNSCSEKLSQCISSENESEYRTVQFWIFFILIIATWVSAGVAVSLADAACYNILEDEVHLYGRQRLWGTIGWGSFVLLTGYFDQLATGASRTFDYSPGFYILVGLMIIDLVSVSYIKMESVKISRNILKDVGSLLVKLHVVAFIFAVFIIGACTGLFWSYLFWYLMNLGATQELLGLSAAVQCFLGELPFFFFSGWIIKTIGHINTLTMTFLAFGVRFVAYSYLQNPWWVLPIELLQGPTFGAFYSAMTSYASVAAPLGTEATMQGLVGGAFEGLGVATGSLLGGLGFGIYDGSFTFFWAGIISFITCFLYVAVHLCLKKSGKTVDINPGQCQQVDGVPEEGAAFL